MKKSMIVMSVALMLFLVVRIFCGPVLMIIQAVQMLGVALLLQSVLRDSERLYGQASIILRKSIFIFK